MNLTTLYAIVFLLVMILDGIGLIVTKDSEHRKVHMTPVTYFILYTAVYIIWQIITFISSVV